MDQTCAHFSYLNTSCLLCKRALSTINNFFDFVIIHKTHSLHDSNCSLISNINIFYQNVRGLRTKLIPLKTNFQTFGNYDIIILTETWLCPSITNSELGLLGYQLHRLDRNHCTRGGGVLIAVRSTFPSVLISTNISTVEHLFIHITNPSINIIVGAVYIPPNSSLQLYESHANIVDAIFSKYTSSKFILCGDYNIPGVDWSSDELGLIASGR